MSEREKGKSAPYESTMGGLNGAGRRTPVMVSPKPMFHADGRFKGSFAVFTDISELKKAQENLTASLREKELLVREIHHRVKNNLQVICSLLSLQCGYAGDEVYREMLEETERRVRAMAVVHNQVYRSSSFDVVNSNECVRNVVKSLFSPIANGWGRIRFKTEIEDLDFKLDTAIQCGLILNELVSNSIKYAFPNDMEGEISIVLRSLGGNKLELIAGDNGVGMPEGWNPTKNGTLGLDLVMAFVEQLEGELTWNSVGGVEFRIKFSEPPESEMPSEFEHVESCDKEPRKT
jgi:two-component sensor histidine kinase